MNIHSTTQVSKEGRLFLEEAEKMGTLDQIIEEAGYLKRKRGIERPKLIGIQRVSVPLPPEHAKA